MSAAKHLQFGETYPAGEILPPSLLMGHSRRPVRPPLDLEGSQRDERRVCRRTVLLLCLCVCLCVRLCVRLCVSMCVSVRLFVSLWVSLTLSLCICGLSES